MTAIPDTVLAGIAIDNQRRVRSGATGDRDMVATDAHAAVKLRIAPGTGTAPVARPQHEPDCTARRALEGEGHGLGR